MSEHEAPASSHDDVWLVRHHITIVVEWAVHMLGRAVLMSLLVSIVLAFVFGLLAQSDAGVVWGAALGSVLGFGCSLYFSTAPFPIKLDDDTDD